MTVVGLVTILQEETLIFWRSGAREISAFIVYSVFSVFIVILANFKRVIHYESQN